MTRTQRVRKGRTLMTPEQQAEHDRQIVANFNAKYPVGTAVWYWETLMPGTPVLETMITGPAGTAPNGDAVCFVDGVSGWVSIWHVQEPNESQRPHLEIKTVGIRTAIDPDEAHRDAVAWGVSETHAKGTLPMTIIPTTDLEQRLAEHYEALTKMPNFDRLTVTHTGFGTPLSATLGEAARELQLLRGMNHSLAEELASWKGTTVPDEIARARHIATIAED